jgi:tripartite-type tricarboxylate transporter receptor subunit TctC
MNKVFAFVALLVFSGLANAQAWPNRPVRLIIPFPPGGGTDLASRSVANKISEAIGQPVVPENRPGAGGTIGADVVAKAAPDGYTIGTATSSTHPAAVALQKGVPYDPVKDFAPITQIASTSFVLLGSPTLPAENFQDLVKHAKANPGRLNVAHVGTTTLGYLQTLQLASLTGIELQPIQYKGSAQVYPDLISGQIQLFLDNPGASTPLVAAGKLKAFGVTTPTPSMPGVPRFVEQGLQGYDEDFWYGLVAPAGTPRPIIERIQKAVAAHVQSEEGKKEYAARSLVPVGNTPEEFAAAIKAEMETFRALAARLIKQ